MSRPKSMRLAVSNRMPGGVLVGSRGVVGWGGRTGVAFEALAEHPAEGDPGELVADVVFD